jgi:hypothetical protein
MDVVPCGADDRLKMKLAYGRMSMRKANWLTALAVVVVLATLGCNRESSVPEPKVPEKAQLPAINDRIEREADQGVRPAEPPTEQPEREGQPLLDRETGR